MDVILASIAITLCAPLMALIAVLIKITSPGPILYRQERCGLNGSSFMMLKFRSLRADAEANGPQMTTKNDPRRTRLGAILRATNMDELPQFFNVLRGDMSLVGPRPCLPVQADVIAARRALDVFSVRPGITGPAQLASIDMSTPEKLAQADRSYVENQTFARDLRIIVATVVGGGSGDAVLR